MAKTSVDIPQLKFNKMSTAKYEELKLAGQLNNNEFYITPDGGTIPEVNETTNDFVLSNNGTDLNWVQETEYTKNRIDSKLNDNVRTNCLTKIPQDIKLELTEGVLILKSGSKIYVPNGLQEDGINKKFNEIIVGEDIQLVTSAPDSHRMFFLQIDINNSITGQWNFGDGQKVDSGDEPEISLYGVWYDISNNIIKISTDGSSWNTDVKLSLPICIAVSDSSNNFVSFDQVFNGFGYLGNTWYVLPGVNVLIPNGFDNNKNYNNINLTITDVRIYTSTVDKSGYLVIQETNVVSDIIKDIQTREEAKENGYYYIINENKHYYYFNNMWNPILRANVGKITYNETGGVISFNPKNVFQAVDRNEADYVIESYQNGPNWYRIYKSGWVEQGGFASSSQNNILTTINLIKPMKDTNYIISTQPVTTSQNQASDSLVSVQGLTTKSFQIYLWTYIPKIWYVCGQGE